MRTNILNAHHGEVRNLGRNTHANPLHARYGKYKDRGVTKTEPSCFTRFMHKVRDVFNATKRILNRVITKVEDYLHKAGTKINDLCEEAYTKIKNIKTPFRKNYVDVNMFGCNVKMGKNAKVKDFFK